MAFHNMLIYVLICFSLFKNPTSHIKETRGLLSGGNRTLAKYVDILKTSWSNNHPFSSIHLVQRFFSTFILLRRLDYFHNRFRLHSFYHLTKICRGIEIV